jgi:hypothetical protein
MFKQEGENVYLNGIEVPLSIFKRLEPTHKFPNDLIVMFYDGERRHYRTKNNSWSIPGIWHDGERYLSRIKEFVDLFANVQTEEAALVEDSVKAVQAAIASTEPDLKAKYPVEEQPNVELQQRDDIKPKRVKRVRSTSKRTPRTGN